REALAAIRDGRVDEAAAAYVDHGRVVVIDDPAGLAQATVDGWWASVGSGADAAMYAYRRHQVAALNASGRVKMAEARRLSGPELIFAPWPGGDLVERRYQAGDELVLLRNRRRLGEDPSGRGVRNGTRATVVSVDPDAGSATVGTTDGRVLRLPRAYLERHSDYGYALTVHKAQGKTLGQAARLGAEDPRLRGEAHVYAADDLSAEAALVGASRAADSSTLYLLSAPEPAPEDHGEPEQREPEVALASGWSRREAKVMAMDELERLRRVEALAVEEPREALVAQRQVLAAVAQGAGPGPGPAEHRVASALAVLPEVVEAEVAVKASLEAEAEAGRQARVAALAEAGRSRSELEDEATLAAMEAEGAERRQARVGDARAAWGTDVVAARSELGLLDEALSTQRRRRLDALAAEPPAYVVDLLGTRPTETAAALRWRQGMGLIEDVRRAGGVRREGVGGRWEVALGPIPTERVARARYGRAVAALEGVRADLGLGEGDRRPQQPDAEGAHHRDRRDRRRRLRAEDDRARRGRRDRGWGLER
ncbi:MAG: hypothetical protein ACRD0L_03905, partial [Acidimicrobiales bacterium]